MARYIIKVVAAPGQEPLALLVPFSPASTLAELTSEIIRRTNQNSTTAISNDATFTIRFQSITGPILDAQDQLADVVRDGEELYFQLCGQSEVSSCSTNTTSSSEFVRQVKSWICCEECP